VILLPDKDSPQCVIGRRVICRIDSGASDATSGRRREVRRPARLESRTGSLSSATAPTDPRGTGLGEKSAATVLARYGRLEAIPDDAARWDVAVRGRSAGTVARERREEAALYRKLATLRNDVPLAEGSRDLEWRGARRRNLEALCQEIGYGSCLARCPAGARLTSVARRHGGLMRAVLIVLVVLAVALLAAVGLAGWRWARRHGEGTARLRATAADAGRRPLLRGGARRPAAPVARYLRAVLARRAAPAAERPDRVARRIPVRPPDGGAVHGHAGRGDPSRRFVWDARMRIGGRAERAGARTASCTAKARCTRRPSASSPWSRSRARRRFAVSLPSSAGWRGGLGIRRPCLPGQERRMGAARRHERASDGRAVGRVTANDSTTTSGGRPVSSSACTARGAGARRRRPSPSRNTWEGHLAEWARGAAFASPGRRGWRGLLPGGQRQVYWRGGSPEIVVRGARALSLPAPSP